MSITLVPTILTDKQGEDRRILKENLGLQTAWYVGELQLSHARTCRRGTSIGLKDLLAYGAYAPCGLSDYTIVPVHLGEKNA